MGSAHVVIQEVPLYQTAQPAVCFSAIWDLVTLAGDTGDSMVAGVCTQGVTV